VIILIEAKKTIKLLFPINPKKITNSPTKLLVPGKLILAIENNKKIKDSKG
jgi:hypothetical protein